MTAPAQIDLLFTYRVKPGEEDRFAASQRAIYPVTERDEPYVIEYELFQREDGSYLQHERYFDEAAIDRHLERTADGQALWNAAVDLLEVFVIGPVSQAFIDRVGGPHVHLLTRISEVRR